MLAAREGVSALALERVISGDIACPTIVRYGLTVAARTNAARSLLLQAETCRVLAHLADAGLPSLLLKGSALAYWLYPSAHLRECVDIDLLLASQAAAEQAARHLEALGYERQMRALPGDLTTYELTCIRQVAGVPVEVDVHWGIGGAPVYASRLEVPELFAGSVLLPRLSPFARGLKPAHALMHAVMHRALNLHLVGDRLKWLHDVHLLAGHFSAVDWQFILEIAGERGLADTCLAAFEASRDTLGTGIPTDVIEGLATAARTEPLQAARMSQWRYIQWRNLRALPNWCTRLRWMWQRIMPSPGYLQDMYGEQGGRAGSWWRYLRHGLGKFRG